MFSSSVHVIKNYFLCVFYSFLHVQFYIFYYFRLLKISPVYSTIKEKSNYKKNVIGTLFLFVNYTLPIGNVYSLPCEATISCFLDEIFKLYGMCLSFFQMYVMSIDQHSAYTFFRSIDDCKYTVFELRFGFFLKQVEVELLKVLLWESRISIVHHVLCLFGKKRSKRWKQPYKYVD